MEAPDYLTKNGNSISIGEACSEDASDLVDYVERVSGESDFLGFGPGEFGISVEEEEGILEDYRSSENKLYLVARIFNEIVGTISFEAGSRPRMAHCCGIGMSVRQDHWNQGVGSALMDELVRRCFLGGIIKKINLRVRTENERAIHLYRKKGFKVEGTIAMDTCVDGHYYDHHLMGLRLKNLTNNSNCPNLSS